MARRRNKAKRSLAALPKGLPQRHKLDVNPFEVSSRQKRPKQDVHNRFSTKPSNPQTALAKSLERRQAQLKLSLATKQKTNTFIDRRIGEYDMTAQDKMLARLVKERSRRSKRASKYNLQDNEDDEMLTHKGRVIQNYNDQSHVMLSDDEDDEGNLDAVDTELHFGGGSFGQEHSMYGPGNNTTDISQVYVQKKTELDDLIARRKLLKAQRVQSKEEQEEVFGNMDESFSELASMLQFRDKVKERQEREEAKKSGIVSKEDEEMHNWDKEMKEYLFERRVKATDRTKTPEEVAKEEAERLHQLETRRLARMNGDFDQDDLTDISDDEQVHKAKRRKTASKKQKHQNPEELDDSDEEEEDEMKVKFTADGLVYVDKDGKTVKRVGEEDNETVSGSSSSDGEEKSLDESDDGIHNEQILAIGTKVEGNYRVKEQFEGQSAWYDGVITAVNKQKDGAVTYDVRYDDGDFEENMEPENVRAVKKSAEAEEKEVLQHKGELWTKRKRQKAKDKARQEIPFVFEVPTTLEALHDMIGNYASTGDDASLIIQRIHKANSVRLNHKNAEKMQNFYDVLLRRFIAVGDAIHTSGDGGAMLGRYKQLDELTKTLYAMSQDSPDCAGAVWGRRLGVFQNAHAKRLRDAEFATDEDDFSAWPSTGTLFLLRAVGHIFPVTDLRHFIVTPTLLLLGQMVAQTPVRSLHDAVMGLTCVSLMIEYTKDAGRIAPEALSFLAGMLRLFSAEPRPGDFSIPSLEAATEWPEFESLRKTLSEMTELETIPRMSLLKEDIESDKTPASILCSALHLVEAQANILADSLDSAETEAFAEITKSLLALKPQNQKYPLPSVIVRRVGEVASAVSAACQLDAARMPLRRRTGPSISEMTVKSLAPRMEDPTRYSMSKDKGKSSIQAARDRARREYKREHKAVARELRLDAAFIENERREEKTRKDSKAREKRNKNYAWLEGEQAAMNQQVRQGGGLLSGGGMGAARAKARSGKLGIKKGGKF